MRVRICFMICSTFTESDRTLRSIFYSGDFVPRPLAPSLAGPHRPAPLRRARPLGALLLSRSRLVPALARELRRFLDAHRQNAERAPQRAQACSFDFRALFGNDRIALAIRLHVFPVPEQP